MIRYTLLIVLPPLLLLTGCLTSKSKSRNESEDSATSSAVSALERVIRNSSAESPWDRFKSAVATASTVVAFIAALGFVVGLGLAVARMPFGKDVAIVSAIGVIGAGLLAAFVTYAVWIISMAAAGLLAYWGYTLWRTARDEKVKRELVQTGDVLKEAPLWTHELRTQLRKIQSPATRATVDKYQERRDAKLDQGAGPTT